MPFLKGYLVGLALIIFIGPVFFTLLKSTLQYNYLSGFMVALGIFISDVVAVLLCTLGFAGFFKNAENQLWISIAGAVILFFLGIKYIFKPNLKFDTDVRLKTSDYAGFFMKGFLVNFVNPFVFLVWIGIITYADDLYGFNWDMAIFLSASLLGILTTDSLKVILAHRIRHLFKPSIMVWVFRVIGIALIGFGIRMVVVSL